MEIPEGSLSETGTVLAEIETVRDAIGGAETQLKRLAERDREAARGDKVLVGDELRAAFSKLRAARAKLDHLLARRETEELANAREAIEAAARELDAILREPVVTTGAEAKWVSEGVEQAFAKLRIAQTALAEVTEAIAAREG